MRLENAYLCVCGLIGVNSMQCACGQREGLLSLSSVLNRKIVSAEARACLDIYNNLFSPWLKPARKVNA
jgi:hypothetical protein